MSDREPLQDDHEPRWKQSSIVDGAAAGALLVGIFGPMYLSTVIDDSSTYFLAAGTLFFGAVAFLHWSGVDL